MLQRRKSYKGELRFCTSARERPRVSARHRQGPRLGDRETTGIFGLCGMLVIKLEK